MAGINKKRRSVYEVPERSCNHIRNYHGGGDFKCIHTPSGLCTKTVRLSDVAVTGNLLLDLMPLMFIPAAVGLIEKFEELKAILVPFLVITVLSTFLVMTITGKAAEAVLNGKEKAGKEGEEK